MSKLERRAGRIFRKEAKKQLDGQFLLFKKMVKQKPRWPLMSLYLAGAAFVCLFSPKFGWELALSLFIKKEIVEDI